MAYSVELDNDELGIVVEALRIQRERWQNIVMKKMANEPSLSHITLDEATTGLRRHEELLKRLPSHGLSI
jgi:hypothetical protein